MNKIKKSLNKINWKIRLKNPAFLAQIGMAVAMPILTYYGLNASDLTTWSSVFDILGNALSNPFVLGTIAVSVCNAIKDPTTKGFGDSVRALQYKKAKEDGQY